MLRILSTTFLLLALTCASFLSYGQITIEGDIVHDNKPISEVIIQVLENDKVVRTVMANKRGKYSIDLPYDHRYSLVYRKSFMVPITIDVHTRLGSENTTQEIVVPLNMELVYRYEEIEPMRVSQSIGEIHKQGDGVNTFGFTPNQRALDAVKVYNDESYKLELFGVKPIDKMEKSSSASSNTNELKTKTLTEAKQGFSQTDTQKPTELERLKTESTVNRFEIAAKSNAIAKETLQAKKENADINLVEKAGSADAFIYDRKKSISAQHSLKLDDKVNQTDELVKKYTILENELIAQNLEGKASVGKSFSPVSIQNEPGWFISEQQFTLSNNKGRTSYRKVIYHLLLTDVTYYYQNSNEITEKEYQKAIDAARD